MKTLAKRLTARWTSTSYDYRNQERISKLEGNVDPAFLQNVLSRAAKAATVSTRTDGFSGAGRRLAPPLVRSRKRVRAQQALEDLVVQVEIFLQYSLHSKAVERLEKIGELFPGEEAKNDRLRARGASNQAQRSNPHTCCTTGTSSNLRILEAARRTHMPAEKREKREKKTHRDLATIAEINRLMHRQRAPCDVLATTTTQIGNISR